MTVVKTVTSEVEVVIGVVVITKLVVVVKISTVDVDGRLVIGDLVVM